MDESIFKRREGRGAPSPEPRCLKRSLGRMMTKKEKNGRRWQHGVRLKDVTAVVR